MRLLLDTHAVIWAALRSSKLSRKARDLIGDDADRPGSTELRELRQHRLGRDEARTEARSHAMKPAFRPRVPHGLVERKQPIPELERDSKLRPLEVADMRPGKDQRT